LPVRSILTSPKAVAAVGTDTADWDAAMPDAETVPPGTA
jgi:hypothetical protein